MTISIFHCGELFAQFPRTQTELSSEIRVDEPEQKIAQLLERAKVAVNDQQWDEVLDTYVSVIEQAGDQIVRLDASRYITVREFCFRQLAATPDTCRKSYRTRFDNQAQHLYEQGLADHDRVKLQRVIDDFFLSSWGDDALFALGELALEQGDASFARQCWIRLLPSEQKTKPANPANADPAKEALPSASPLLIYPETNIAAAEVRARMILALIGEQNWKLAKTELEKFKQEFPTQPGRLGGKSGIWSELLSKQIEIDLARANALSQSAISSPTADTTTFAADATRSGRYPLDANASLKNAAWQKPIQFPGTWQMSELFNQMFQLPQQRRGPNSEERLVAVHPVLARGMVFYCDEERVYAFDLNSGTPAWPSENRMPGEIYLSNLQSVKQPVPNIEFLENQAEDKHQTSLPKVLPGSHLYYSTGTGPQFTLTVQENLLLARLGSPITVASRSQNKAYPSQLVCLNLDRQGLEQWSIKPPGERWSFEGTPVADHDHAFAILRYNDIRPQLHIACYDLRTGIQTWRRMICAGETATRGMLDEISHLLPTLAEGRLYVATNLGAVAAIDAESGRILWITQYKRAKQFDSATHWYRNLTPPVYNRGTIYVAPTDSPSIIAIDSASGIQLWENSKIPDTIHLLGITDDGANLIVSGKQLSWLDSETGQINRAFPDLPAGDKEILNNPAHGRGLLAQGLIYWPRRHDIAILNQNISKDGAKKNSDDPKMMEPKTIKVELISNGMASGNLTADGTHLLITTSKEIWAVK